MNLSDYTKDGEDHVFGWLCYSGQEIHDRSCLLRENESRFELIVPFKGQTDEISEWFVNSSMPFDFGLGEERQLPPLVWLEDIQGHENYLLVNPRVTSRSTTTGTFRGHGVLTPDHLVVGNPGIDYSSVNRVRTYIPELIGWSGLSSLSMEYERSEEDRGSLKSFKAGFRDEDPVEVATIENTKMSLVPCDWSTAHRGVEPSVTVKSAVKFETETSDRESFEAHITRHLDLLGLLSILAWRNVGFKEIAVSVNDDVVADIAGNVYGPHFHRLITKYYEDWAEPTNARPWNLYFKDIGAKGLAKWFDLKDAYRNTLNEITYIARMQKHLTLQGQVLLYGSAFEELGKEIARERKRTLKRGIDDSVREILHDCEYQLFSREEELVKDISYAYNAAKHADFSRADATREECLSVNNLIRVTTACRCISQLWAGNRIGCDESYVTNLKQDSAIGELCKKWI